MSEKSLATAIKGIIAVTPIVSIADTKKENSMSKNIYFLSVALSNESSLFKIFFSELIF